MKNSIFRYKQKEDVIIESGNIALKITKVEKMFKLQLKCPKSVDKSERMVSYEFYSEVDFENIKEKIPQIDTFLTIRNATGIELEIFLLSENVLKVYFYLKDYSYDWSEKYSFSGKQDMYIYPGSQNYQVFVDLYNVIKNDIFKKEVAKYEHKSNRIKH